MVTVFPPLDVTAVMTPPAAALTMVASLLVHLAVVVSVLVVPPTVSEVDDSV